MGKLRINYLLVICIYFIEKEPSNLDESMVHTLQALKSRKLTSKTWFWLILNPQKPKCYCKTKILSNVCFIWKMVIIYVMNKFISKISRSSYDRNVGLQYVLFI